MNIGNKYNLRPVDVPHCGICKWFTYRTIYSDGECQNKKRINDIPCAEEAMVCDLFEERNKKWRDKVRKEWNK